MARHDERERVSPERLADLAREAAFAEARGKLAVGERGPCRDCPRRFVDAAIEFRDVLHIERNDGQVAPLALKQRGDRLDRAPHIAWRRCLARLRISARKPRAGFSLARLRQLHAADAARAPCDAAAADTRVEECKSVCSHGAAILKQFQNEYRRTRNDLGVLPSPLWGGAGGGGPSADHRTTPTPALRADPPHKGEGRDRVRRSR